MNSTLMVRPMPWDGTSRYSIGRPGLEYAAAVGDSPATLTSAGNTAAAAAATASRRNPLRAIPPTIAIAALPPRTPTRLADDTSRISNHHLLLTNSRSRTVGVYHYKNNQMAHPRGSGMDRDQLIDLTRRAVKLARDKTTDLTPSEHIVPA